MTWGVLVSGTSSSDSLVSEDPDTEVPDSGLIPATGTPAVAIKVGIPSCWGSDSPLGMNTRARQAMTATRSTPARAIINHNGMPARNPCSPSEFTSLSIAIHPLIEPVDEVDQDDTEQFNRITLAKP